MVNPLARLSPTVRSDEDRNRQERFHPRDQNHLHVQRTAVYRGGVRKVQEETRHELFSSGPVVVVQSAVYRSSRSSRSVVEGTRVSYSVRGLE